MKHPYKRIFQDGRPRLEHIVLAERALGKPLPKGCEVHHVNENKLDNSPENLVVCPSHAYHTLLHKRAKALNACGNASWLRCTHCKQYDEPANLSVMRTGAGAEVAYHKRCNTEAARLYKMRKAA